MHEENGEPFPFKRNARKPHETNNFDYPAESSSGIDLGLRAVIVP